MCVLRRAQQFNPSQPAGLTGRNGTIMKKYDYTTSDMQCKRMMLALATGAFAFTCYVIASIYWSNPARAGESGGNLTTSSILLWCFAASFALVCLLATIGYQRHKLRAARYYQRQQVKQLPPPQPTTVRFELHHVGNGNANPFPWTEA